MALFGIFKYFVVGFVCAVSLTDANEKQSERDLMNDERKTERIPDEIQLMRDEKDNADLIQTLSLHMRNQNEMIQDLTVQVQDISRSVRDLQDSVDGLGTKSENLETTVQKQTMSMSSAVNRVRKEDSSARGPLFKIVEDIKDTTYFLAATLIKREDIPYLRRCNKTKDVSSCVRPEVNRRYNDLSIPVRIADGHVDGKGRVEIFHRGSWTTVCDHGWDYKDAQVVCKMLGYSKGSTLQGPSFLNGYHFNEGRGIMTISNVQCTGEETSVLSCPFYKPSFDCSHYDDAGVECEK